MKPTYEELETTVQALRDDNKMHIDHLFETRVKVDQLEAQCAAMREALEWYAAPSRNYDSTKCTAARALASTAGQDLLEELKALRALRDLIDQCQDALPWKIIETADAAKKWKK